MQIEIGKQQKLDLLEDTTERFDQAVNNDSQGKLFVPHKISSLYKQDSALASSTEGNKMSLKQNKSAAETNNISNTILKTKSSNGKPSPSKSEKELSKQFSSP